MNAFTSVENFAPVATAIGGGFFVGLLIGYALKKVVKILAIVVGLFFAGVAYLQYQQIVNIDWNKLQPVSQTIQQHNLQRIHPLSRHQGFR